MYIIIGIARETLVDITTILLVLIVLLLAAIWEKLNTILTHMKVRKVELDSPYIPLLVFRKKPRVIGFEIPRDAPPEP